MSNQYYRNLKGFFASKRIVFLSIIGIPISCGFVSGCTPADTNYIQTKIGGVSVCDLGVVDTPDILGIGKIDSKLRSSKFISLYDETKTEWKTSDINISRCSPKISLDFTKALRIHIPEEKWSHGFQFTYDLYFDEGDRLIAIESRHRFIDI